MSFFVKAVVDALKAVPQVNARVEGDEIITNHFYDIGVAVVAIDGDDRRDGELRSLGRVQASLSGSCRPKRRGRSGCGEVQKLTAVEDV